MKSLFYFRLMVFSILGAASVSLISIYCLVRISDVAVENYRYGYLMYVARSIEKSNNYRPVSRINVKKVDAPPLASEHSLVTLTEFGPGMKEESRESVPGPLLWLISREGIVLSTNANAGIPIEWKKLRLPSKIHGIEINETNFLDPKTFVIKLDTTPVTYLISHNPKTLFQGPYLLIQGIHTFTTAALAVFLALSISFYYLRKKSSEARKVLGKLEGGDLKARFEIKRFDEFGSLLLDFNRMAEEIERLVMRLRETEISRSNLLQELGHDLRTPLTSLSTALETLRDHHDALSSDDRRELFSMVATDIRYFKDLLDKLTLIATIDGPHYKSSTEKINLHHLLLEELQSRQTATGSSLNWTYVPESHSSTVILGDNHLITRLFRNAFDNASRYAKNSVTVKVNGLKDKIEVLVIDDGPGLSEESLRSFGKRRERRLRKGNDDFSLGLGSVIMRTIAQVHGGQVEIMNRLSSGEINGACLRVTFLRT